MATQAQLTTRYNELATQLGQPTISLWKKSKAIIEAKIADMEKQLKPVAVKKTTAPKKEKAEKISQDFVTSMNVHILQGNSMAAAFRAALLANKVTRVQAFHSAMVCGMNMKAAKNLFDRISKTGAMV